MVRRVGLMKKIYASVFQRLKKDPSPSQEFKTIEIEINVISTEHPGIAKPCLYLCVTPGGIGPLSRR